MRTSTLTPTKPYRSPGQLQRLAEAQRLLRELQTAGRGDAWIADRLGADPKTIQAWRHGEQTPQYPGIR